MTLAALKNSILCTAYPTLCKHEWPWIETLKEELNSDVHEREDFFRLFAPEIRATAERDFLAGRAEGSR